MSDSLVCRSARPEDLPTLLEFEQGIIAYERPFDPNLAPDPISYYDIGEMIGADWAEVAVVTAGARIVGAGYAKRRTVAAYFTPREQSFLGFMFVDPAFRGRGVNKMVVEWLLEWSRQRGLREVRLQVYSENASALRAYEKVGFTRRMTEMRLRLD